jgi:hypothetical protein
MVFLALCMACIFNVNPRKEKIQRILLFRGDERDLAEALSRSRRFLRFFSAFLP